MKNKMILTSKHRNINDHYHEFGFRNVSRSINMTSLLRSSFIAGKDEHGSQNSSRRCPKPYRKPQTVGIHQRNCFGRSPSRRESQTLLQGAGNQEEDDWKHDRVIDRLWRHNDKLLFQMKGSLQETQITSFEAEVMTLKLGLTEALASGIKHISIYTDCYPLYRDLSKRNTLAQPKLAILMDDVHRIKNQFESNKVFLVSGNDFKFAYDLASAALVSECSIPIKEFCSICFDEININQMFHITGCADSFCCECMKQHIEVKLFEGQVLNCPRYLCKNKLTLNSCESLLTPKLRAIWEQRTIENSIPTAERVYCPYPKCSALMSKTDISEAGLKRSCIKCGEHFCINCKVPWHNDLLCDDYIRLYPNSDDAKLQDLANQRMWRQCNSCGHMISVYIGCSAVTCRCGHSFCYWCGVELGNRHEPCRNHPLFIDDDDVEYRKCCAYFHGFLGIILLVLWLFLGFHYHWGRSFES